MASQDKEAFGVSQGQVEILHPHFYSVTRATWAGMKPVCARVCVCVRTWQTRVAYTTQSDGSEVTAKGVIWDEGDYMSGTAVLEQSTLPSGNSQASK